MKELSIEEKAKRYDKAIKIAKSKIKYDRDHILNEDDIIAMFPELKQSEDESIRKALLEMVNDTKGDDLWINYNVHKEDAIAWLEKQTDKVELLEVKGHTYSGVTFKYNGHIWGMCARDGGVEILVDGNIKERVFLDNEVKNKSEFEKNENEEIRKWLIGYFQEYKSTGIEGFANGLKIDSIIAWLKKQSEQKSINNDFKAKDCYVSNVDGKIHIASKVEPKFKIKDWVIDKQGIVHQIANVIENVTNHTYSYDIVGGGYFNDNINGVRLWTIEDAKDGDVLAVNSEVFIYAHRKQMYPIVVAHCFVDSAGGFRLDGEFGFLERGNSISPATKEQRDLLFQKMKEAGYKWDVDKKIPIKVTTMSKTQTSQYCYILNYNTGEVFKHHITEDEVNLTTEELLKKYGFKETECHIMYSSNNLELKLLEN